MSNNFLTHWHQKSVRTMLNHCHNFFTETYVLTSFCQRHTLYMTEKIHIVITLGKFIFIANMWIMIIATRQEKEVKCNLFADFIYFVHQIAEHNWTLLVVTFFVNVFDKLFEISVHRLYYISSNEFSIQSLIIAKSEYFYIFAFLANFKNINIANIVHPMNRAMSKY